MHIAFDPELIPEKFSEQWMQQWCFSIFIAFASKVLPEEFQFIVTDFCGIDC